MDTAAPAPGACLLAPAPAGQTTAVNPTTLAQSIRDDYESQITTRNYIIVGLGLVLGYAWWKSQKHGK